MESDIKRQRAGETQGSEHKNKVRIRKREHMRENLTTKRDVRGSFRKKRKRKVRREAESWPKRVSAQ